VRVELSHQRALDHVLWLCDDDDESLMGSKNLLVGYLFFMLLFVINVYNVQNCIQIFL